MTTLTLLTISMDVFLIRHGETNGNLAWRHQHPDTQLNAKGKAQVARAVEVIAAFSPTHLFTSTNLRAVETARVLAEATDLIPTTSHLFEELRRPARIFGARFMSLATVSYIVGWFYGRNEDGGESYAAFTQRLIAARTLLETLPSDARVVVVSHSVFINMFIEHRCREKRISLIKAAWRFVRVMRLKNTGVVHLRYTGKTKEHNNVCVWELVPSRSQKHNSTP